MLIVNELLDRISLEPILVMQEDYTALLGPTEELQHKVLKACLKYALLEYEKYEMWDQSRVIALANSRYEFTPIITDSDQTTYPIPEAVSYIKSGSTVFNNVNPWLMGASASEKLQSDYNSSQSARLWNYVKPVFTAQYDGSLLLRTLSHRPYVFNDTVDNKFSEDSKIWGLDIENVNFYNEVLFTILRRIKDIRESVSMSTPIQFLNNIDTELNRLKDLIDTYIRTNAKGMSMWRK